MFFKISNWNSV